MKQEDNLFFADTVHPHVLADDAEWGIFRVSAELDKPIIRGLSQRRARWLVNNRLTNEYPMSVRWIIRVSLFEVVSVITLPLYRERLLPKGWSDVMIRWGERLQESDLKHLEKLTRESQ
jgi:hypothetical protein